MKELSIKKLIEFRLKTEKAKKTFAQNLRLEREKKDTDGGGDYWISSLSAISNCYKLNDLQIIRDKIYELEEKFENTDYKLTKAMYGRNIDVLYKYEIYNFNIWKPKEKITFIKKNKSDTVLSIKGLKIQTKPHHLFSFQVGNITEIGAIWFISKLGGFKESELGMFTDALYRYLISKFSKNYAINPSYCIAFDVVNGYAVNYSQLQKGEVPLILDETISDIKKSSK